MANSLKSLERCGVVRREADARDGRRNRVTITEEGRTVMRRCQGVFREVEEAMYAGFSDAELCELDGYLARMMENLHRIGGRVPDFDMTGEETSNDQAPCPFIGKYKKFAVITRCSWPSRSSASWSFRG